MTATLDKRKILIGMAYSFRGLIHYGRRGAGEVAERSAPFAGNRK